MLTSERAREMLSYDPDTGLFTWRKTPSRNVSAGSPAGTMTSRRYVRIQIDGKLYRAHRVAWLYQTGAWPTLIDHVDGDASNNAWSNLRDVSPQINAQNRRSARAGSLSGLLGVSKEARQQQWRADICVGGQRICLGRFKSKELAHQAYVRAKRRLHAGCTI